MKKEEFLEELADGLRGLPDAEVKKACSFYYEAILDRMEDGMSEEEAVASLGPLWEIIEETKSNTDIPTIITQKIKESREKASNKGLWILLVVLGSPLWFTLLLAMIGILLAVTLAFAALGIAGFAVIFASFAAAVGLVLEIFKSIATGGFNEAIFLTGLALMSLGLGFALIAPMIKFSQIILRVYHKVLNKIKGTIAGRR